MTLAIVALSASVIILNAPSAPGEERDAADRFAARLTVASHLSITSGRLIGLEVDETAFQFFEYRDGEWETPDDKALASASFPAGIAVEITVSEETAKNVEKDDSDEGDREEDKPFPSVFFAPTGDVTALSATFTTRRGSQIVNLSDTGEIEVRREE